MTVPFLDRQITCLLAKAFTETCFPHNCAFHFWKKYLWRRLQCCFVLIPEVWQIGLKYQNAEQAPW